MKANLLTMLRGEWALHPQWVQANLALADRYLRGEGIGDAAEEADRNPEAVLMYSPMYRVNPYTTNLDKLPQGSTAFVDVVGVITKYGGMCSYGCTEYAELTDRLSAAENISTIIYNIDGPGGQVYGTQNFADAIKRSPKRTIGFINDGYAASATYWIASSCDELYCSHDTDEVGSIGVYCVLQDVNAYLAKEGLPVYEIYAPQSTEKNGDVREALKGNVKPLQANLAVLADAFIQTVETNRAGKLKDDAWKKGAMFYAPDALKMGLIDGIKNLAEITAMIEAGEVPTDTPSEEEEQEPVIVDESDNEAPEASDDNSSTPQSNNSNTMFGKKKTDATASFAALSALSGKKADEITEEEAAAANAELHAAGIDGDVVLARTSTINASTKRIAELEGEVKTLGAKPGGFFKTAASADVAGDDSPDGAEDDLDSLAHNIEADRMLGV